MEVAEEFMKTKENGENIYKTMNALLRDCLNEKGNKRYKEEDREKNAWRTVGQFLIVPYE